MAKHFKFTQQPDKEKPLWENEYDDWTQPHHVIIEETRDVKILKHKYDKVCSETRQLVSELRLYEERLGYEIPEFDSTQKEGYRNIYDMMGINPGTKKSPILTELGFDYFTPLIIAYQKKIEFLEHHLKDKYSQLIKQDGDVKTQVELQQKLADQLEDKYKQLMNLQEKFKHGDYFSNDIVDTLNLEDMRKRDEDLQKQNEIVSNKVEQLNGELMTYQNEIQKAQNLELKLKSDVEDVLVAKNMDLEKKIEVLDKEIDILGKRTVEIQEQNDDLETRLYRITDEHDEAERNHNIIQMKYRKLTEWDKKNDEDKKNEENRINNELNQEKNKSERDDLKIKNLENDQINLEAKKSELTNNLESKKREKDEWNIAWKRVEDNLENIYAKRDEYKNQIKEYQDKHQEAREKKELVLRRQDDWERQKREVKEQFQQRQVGLRKKFEEENSLMLRDQEHLNSEKNEELNLLKKRIKGMEADNTRIEKELMRLVEEEKFRKQDLSVKRKDEKIQELKDKLEVANQNINSRQNEIGHLVIGRDDYDRVKQELNNLSNELNRLESEKSALTKRFDTGNNRKGQLENEIRSMKEEISMESKRRISDMTSQNKKIQDEITKNNEIDSNLKIELGKLCQTIDAEEKTTREYMSQRMDDWDSKLQEKTMEILDIKKKIHALAS